MPGGFTPLISLVVNSAWLAVWEISSPLHENDYCFNQLPLFVSGQLINADAMRSAGIFAIKNMAASARLFCSY